MADIQFDCAHCGTKKAGAYIHYLRADNHNLKAHTFCECSVCGNNTYLILIPYTNEQHKILYRDSTDAFRSAIRKISFAEVFRQLPEPESIAAPSHTPQAIAHQYAESIQALNAGAYGPAAMGFRSVLDFASKALGGQHRNLRPRLEELKNVGVIPDALHAWAEQMALDGNEAAHEPPPNADYAQARARELADYTRLFLVYAYEMPGRVAQRRAEADARRPRDEAAQGAAP